MKNYTLVALTLIITVALSAFTFSNWKSSKENKPSCQSIEELEPPTIFYSLSARTNNTISKNKLYNATTISDLLPDARLQEDLKNNRIAVRDVKIKIYDGNIEKTVFKLESRNEFNLSEEQINFLRSLDYSMKFHLEGFFMDSGFIIDKNNERFFNYNMAVVPETQANYGAGRDAFIEFFESNCQSEIEKVQNGDLKYGSISFTVTATGTISNIVLLSSSGYDGIDKKMMELMTEVPRKWNIAVDSDGEKVDQMLVFSFGQQGC